MSNFRKVEISPDNNTITVGAGIDWGQALLHSSKVGKTVNSGAFPYIGITGFIQGGGLGFLSSQFGLSCDSVQSLKVVTFKSGKAELLDVDATHYSDLFWAIRGGGGGNFGIVTQITLKLFQLHNETNLLFLECCWDVDQFFEVVLPVYRNFLNSMDKEFGEMLTMSRTLVCIYASWAGNVATGREKFEKIHSMGVPSHFQISYESILQQAIPTQQNFLSEIQSEAHTYQPFSAILGHSIGNNSDLYSQMATNAFKVPSRMKVVTSSTDFVPEFSTVTRPYNFGGSVFLSSFWPDGATEPIKDFLSSCPAAMTCGITSH
eukprot:CAMPEP_0174273932 /NCGR_PEP_ID=MMETSP0439-20130205/56323_1 /TAXON_ID=0 /ORGANISM="Stereomyxa ramosa, Strain Chinc5" /LENGTH=318 /DNA_ID=CAMNT_0015365427 /DNA_START=353 /DNA_END=1306 /DNA_ORIENTATION=+